ncbi:MAG: hypothetical protein M1840_000913 [Geoglossum simile]|nr:MAG: hypothetical protein M1840_000913 [Geoglossum simile]
MKLWMYWVSDQGPITRDSKVSGRKTFQQKTKNSLKSLQEQVERSQLQSQLLAEQDRLTQHTEQQKECQYRREEKEEERQARREDVGTLPFGPSLLQPQLETSHVSRKSSPISSELDDSQILHRFFEHKIAGQIPEVADKWQRAWRIVDAIDWSVTDLNEMENERVFKQVHREQEEAANTLVSSGGFNST